MRYPSEVPPNNENIVVSQDPCDKGKDESFADSFGAPWEYKEILKDIVTKKSFPDQEYGTELKELYTQISKTIDLLNA